MGAGHGPRQTFLGEGSRAHGAGAPDKSSPERETGFASGPGKVERAAGQRCYKHDLRGNREARGGRRPGPTTCDFHIRPRCRVRKQRKRAAKETLAESIGMQAAVGCASASSSAAKLISVAVRKTVLGDRFQPRGCRRCDARARRSHQAMLMQGNWSTRLRRYACVCVCVCRSALSSARGARSYSGIRAMATGFAAVTEVGAETPVAGKPRSTPEGPRTEAATAPRKGEGK